ncbi:MAG: iron-containing alcohol dehydrogenase [Chloroflexota bacterium]|nr:iron-containing alcohol dehydrogenase [Chloroflexota bacterium]
MIREAGVSTGTGAEPDTGREFVTVFGRQLIGELPNFVHRPYLVVTMADLWPRFEHLFDSHLAGVHCVTTLELEPLTAELEGLPPFESVVGLGGGQAMDVAKFIAWSRRVPLFQAPTAMTTNAPFAHRAALRHKGTVVPLGWAVPEAVYVDLEVIRSAPALLNRSGVGDVLCYHTAHFDWKLARDAGREEPRWPYDERLVAEARRRLDTILASLDEIHAVTDEGIRTLMLVHRWGGASFHNAGWNARHMDGVDHCYLYALEHLTGKHFIHGQAVGLGTYIGAVLQENEPEMVLSALHRTGVDIRPEAMGISWEDAAAAMRQLQWYVRYADLWYTIADARPVSDGIVEQVREGLYTAFGSWDG